LQWARRLEAEFFAQGDKEKSLALPTSFLMDREKPGVSTSQIGFFDFVVLPLFRALARGAPAASDVLLSVTANYQHWRDLETSGVDGGDAAGKRAVRSQSSLSVSSTAEEASMNNSNFGEVITTAGRKRSGRTRQRASKWWASVRQRTPSPSSAAAGLRSTTCKGVSSIDPPCPEAESKCAIAGCSRRSYNGAPGQYCCKRCRDNCLEAEGHERHCEQKHKACAET